MSGIKLMYLYFDKDGTIKEISPIPNPENSMFSVITIPIKEVEPFLLGKKNTFDYFVREINRVGIIAYKITRKAFPSSLRSVDNFVTEIPTFARSSEANI